MPNNFRCTDWRPDCCILYFIFRKSHERTVPKAEHNFLLIQKRPEYVNFCGFTVFVVIHSISTSTSKYHTAPTFENCVLWRRNSPRSSLHSPSSPPYFSHRKLPSELFLCLYALCFFMCSLFFFNPASQLPYISKLSWVEHVHKWKKILR